MPRATAALVVLTSGAMLGVAASYAAIQQERTCGQSDVAVKLVSSLLRNP